jgi:hypothetical protein
MPSREECRAENEGIFRAGNETIVSNARDLQPMLPLICECGTRECLERIRLTQAEYDEVRLHPARFAVASGHQDETETVVGEFDRYSVVEKTGAGRAVVE